MKTSARFPFRLVYLVAVLALGSLSATAQVAGDTNLITPVVTIQAQDASANEGGDPGRLVVLRAGTTNGALTVWLQVSGTAMPGVDYRALSNTVVIPDGQRGVEIAVQPVEDTTPEPVESIVVRVVPSPLLSPVTPYVVGTPGVAQVNLADNDSNTASNLPPVVTLVQPTAGTRFPAGTRITLTAEARDLDGSVAAVEFFANQVSLGQGVRASNAAGTVSSNVWVFSWLNAPVGSHVLTARATDNAGASVLSAGVSVSVVVSNQAPVVAVVQPVGGTRLEPGSSPRMVADVRDVDGTVVEVEFFANQVSLGRGEPTVVIGGTSSNLWSLVWSNVAAGDYVLTARARDNGGAAALSAGVRVSVVASNQAPRVAVVQPVGGTRLEPGSSPRVMADVRDVDGTVVEVEFFANQRSLGLGEPTVVAGGTSSNLWSLVWSNVAAGDYVLTARARDNGGAAALSAGVRVAVGTNSVPPTPTNELVLVTIAASDPYAGEGLAVWTSNAVIGVNNELWRTNSLGIAGTNTATFVVRRSGATNESLRIYYGIGGTASNGVDYESLPGVVTIPAGRRAAEFRVMPLEDALPERLETVVLRLRLPPLPLDPADRPYTLARPAEAAAFIVDNDTPPPQVAPLPEGLFHAIAPITNGCFRVEVTTNLFHWEIVCTNRVADGMARHIDAEGTNLVRRFFRLVPVPCPAE